MRITTLLVLLCSMLISGVAHAQEVRWKSSIDEATIFIEAFKPKFALEVCGIPESQFPNVAYLSQMLEDHTSNGQWSKTYQNEKYIHVGALAKAMRNPAQKAKLCNDIKSYPTEFTASVERYVKIVRERHVQAGHAKIGDAGYENVILPAPIIREKRKVETEEEAQARIARGKEQIKKGLLGLSPVSKVGKAAQLALKTLDTASDMLGENDETAEDAKEKSLPCQLHGNGQNIVLGKVTEMVKKPEYNPTKEASDAIKKIRTPKGNPIRYVIIADGLKTASDLALMGHAAVPCDSTANN